MKNTNQNTSHAVMQQRHEAADSLDHFPTPPWATRALCEELGGLAALRDLTCWEPACAEGHMSQPLAEYFRKVHSSDVHDYGFGTVRDFLWPGEGAPVDWVITNPPFRLAAQFIARAIPLANAGCAFLVRQAFLEGGARYAELFSRAPPSLVLQFAERVPMVKGRLDGTASTATSYCWLVWRKSDISGDTRFRWIAPCRKRLERAADYAAMSA